MRYICQGIFFIRLTTHRFTFFTWAKVRDKLRDSLGLSRNANESVCKRHERQCLRQPKLTPLSLRSSRCDGQQKAIHKAWLRRPSRHGAINASKIPPGMSVCPRPRPSICLWFLLARNHARMSARLRQRQRSRPQTEAAATSVSGDLWLTCEIE